MRTKRNFGIPKRALTTAGDLGPPPAVQIKPGVELLHYLTYAHMFSAAMILVEKAGGKINAGVKKAVDETILPVVSGIDEFTRRRVIMHAVRSGDITLTQCGAPNELTRLLAVAYSILKLVEEERINGDTTLATAALGMVMEAETDGDPFWATVKAPKTYCMNILLRAEAEILKY